MELLLLAPSFPRVFLYLPLCVPIERSEGDYSRGNDVA